MEFQKIETIQCGNITCIVKECYAKEGEQLQSLLEKIIIKQLHKETLG